MKRATARNRTAGTILSLLLVSACGANSPEPPYGPSASSTIRFSFADQMTSAGIPVCDESDLAMLGVTPSGLPSRTQQTVLSRGQDCRTDFTVTVPRGRVDFSGRLVGGGRTIMLGGQGDFVADEDGFVVVIDLEEIDALNIETRTIGLGGPEAYTFSLEGSDLRFPIGLDDADTLAALAGGPRQVTLHPEPCVVVKAPADREVMIPGDDAQLGATLFEVDCNQAGTVDLIILSGPPKGPYTAWIGDHPPYASRADSMQVSDVTPGPLDIVLEAGDGCTATPMSQEPPFLPSGGHLRVEYEIHCGGGGGGTPPPPGSMDSIRVVTRIPHQPLPGEIRVFHATVAGASGASQMLPMSVPDSVTFAVPSGDYPHVVTLRAMGTCFPKGGQNTRSLVAPKVGATRVVFDVIC